MGCAAAKRQRSVGLHRRLTALTPLPLTPTPLPMGEGLKRAKPSRRPARRPEYIRHRTQTRAAIRL